jgi:hypothetical protein
MTLMYLRCDAGMCLADMDTNGMVGSLRKLRERHSSVFFAVQTLLLLFAWYFGTYPYQQTQGSVFDSMWVPMSWLNAPWLWLTAGAFLLLLSLLSLTEFQDLLSATWAQFLGRTSFAIYLLHYIVLMLADILVMPYLGPAFNQKGHHDRTGAAFFCFVFIIVPVTLVSSHYFYKYVDEPSIECAKDFSDFWLTHFPRCCACLGAKKSVTLEAHDQSKSLVVDDAEQARFHDVINNNGLASDPKESAKMVEKPTVPKKMLLLCILLAFLIPCCVPYDRHNTCYVDDDSN